MCISDIFFCKQKTTYEVSECDWCSDVCSSDLNGLFSTTIDVVTAHGLCKKAQSVFLEDLIEYEEMVRFERLRLKLLVNLLIIDSDISEEDNDLINLLVLESALNDSDKELLLKSLSTKETLKVEISTMEIDYAMALNLLMSIIKLLQINGSMSQIQILYLKKMGSNMGVISGDIDLLIQ